MARYVLSPRYRLRGWDLLPFALFDAATRRAEFYHKEQFRLLMCCDGLQEIDLGAPPEEERGWLEHLEADNVILTCGPGAMLLPEQLYKRYPCRYKRDVNWLMPLTVAGLDNTPVPVVLR